MKTILLLLKPTLQLALVVLPGLFLILLGVVWFWHRRTHRSSPPPNDARPE